MRNFKSDYIIMKYLRGNKGGANPFLLLLIVLLSIYCIQLNNINDQLIESANELVTAVQNMNKEFPGIGVRIYPESSPMIITDVIHGSPAEASGIKPNDIILKLNNKPVLNFKEFKKGFEKMTSGDVAQIELIRNKKRLIVKTKIAIFKPKIVFIIK